LSTLSCDGATWTKDVIAKCSALCRSMGALSFEPDAIDEIAAGLV